MHVPWSSSTGTEVDDTDNGLLYNLILTLQVFSQDLGLLRPCQGLRPGDLRHGWERCCDPGQVKQFAANNFHLSLSKLPANFDRASLCALRYDRRTPRISGNSWAPLARCARLGSRLPTPFRVLR